MVREVESNFREQLRLITKDKPTGNLSEELQWSLDQKLSEFLLPSSLFQPLSRFIDKAEFGFRKVKLEALPQSLQSLFLYSEKLSQEENLARIDKLVLLSFDVFEHLSQNLSLESDVEVLQLFQYKRNIIENLPTLQKQKTFLDELILKSKEHRQQSGEN